MAGNNAKTADKQENKVSLDSRSVKNAADSIATFLSISSGIILILSMSYTIGYFRHINPRFIELLEINDYLNEAAHNTGLFLVAISLFFSSSIAFVKEKISGKFEKLILFGIFTLTSCVYVVFKGINYCGFWRMIEFFLKDYWLMSLVLIALLSFTGLSTFIIYKIFFKFSKTSKIPLYYVNIIPILIFFVLILVPYLSGMIQGYTESSFLTKQDYKYHLVQIILLPNEAKLDNVLIIRQLNRGLILRQFEKESNLKSSYNFLNWGSVIKIIYDNKYEAEEKTLNMSS